jgi:hypothetical protein
MLDTKERSFTEAWNSNDPVDVDLTDIGQKSASKQTQFHSTTSNTDN